MLGVAYASVDVDIGDLVRSQFVAPLASQSRSDPTCHAIYFGCVVLYGCAFSMLCISVLFASYDCLHPLFLFWGWGGGVGWGGVGRIMMCVCVSKASLVSLS